MTLSVFSITCFTKILALVKQYPQLFLFQLASSANLLRCQMYTFYCLLRKMKGLFFLRRQMYTFGRTLRNKIELFSVARIFFFMGGGWGGVRGGVILVNICLVCLSGTEEPQHGWGLFQIKISDLEYINSVVLYFPDWSKVFLETLL